jgi:hypothetical protein
MRTSLNVIFSSIIIAGSTTALAEDHMMNHQMHMATMSEDTRQTVSFPPMMREHTLSNMRDHLQALSEILSSLSEGKYAEAANIADSRLGMESPAAEGCKNDATAPQMSMAPSMEQQMNKFMPEGMRGIGLEMHKAASAFAGEATHAVKSNDAKPALAALSLVTRQCAACHSTYKVQ